MNTVTRFLSFNFFCILSISSLTVRAEDRKPAGELLEEGLRRCKTEKLAEFYEILEKEKMGDFDYHKRAAEFFRCGTDATKLFLEKGTGQKAIDLEYEQKNYVPDLFHIAFDTNNEAVVEELLKKSKPETIHKALEESKTINMWVHLSCPTKYYAIFAKYIKLENILFNKVRSTQTDTVDAILKIGIDINSCNSEDNTPLMELFHANTYSDKEKTAKVLLQYKPDLSKKNKAGKTIFDIAKEKIEKLCFSKDESDKNKCEDVKKAFTLVEAYKASQK